MKMPNDEFDSSCLPNRKIMVKLPLYNGETSLNTWLAQFHNAAVFNNWNSKAQLAHLTNSLTGRAADAVFERGDLPPGTIEDLINILKLKFGDEGQAEKFRAELKTRKQHSGESLQSLHLDIQRIASKAYPGARNETADLIARDAFLDALSDQDVAYRIRELDTSNIDEAYKHAVRISAIRARKMETCQSDSSQIAVAKCIVANTLDSVEVQPSTCSRMRDSGTQKSNDNTLQQLLDRITVLEEKLQLSNPCANSSNVQPQFTRNYGRKFGNNIANSGRNTWKSRSQPPRETAINNQSNITAGYNNLSTYSGCFACGSLDHMVRACPNKQALTQQWSTGPQHPAQTLNAYNNTYQVPVSSTPSIQQNGYVCSTIDSSHNSRVPTYIHGYIAANNAYFLVDTGCDTCILPFRLAGSLHNSIRDHKANLTAANGTRINIQGIVTLSFTLDDQQFVDSFMVTPDVDEIILGQSFICNLGISTLKRLISTESPILCILIVN